MASKAWSETSVDALEKLAALERRLVITPMQRRFKNLHALALALGFAVSGELLLPTFAILYWSADQYKCFAGIWLVPLSEIANGVIKWLTRRPRPAWVDPTVELLSWSSEFSFPSSHSQLVAALAACFVLSSGHVEATTVTPAAPAIAFALAVGLSRVHQGLHYPTDVLVGLALGGVSGALHTRYVMPALPLLELLSFPRRLGLLLLPAVLAATSLAAGYAHALRSEGTDPPRWKRNACAGRFKAKVLDPRGTPFGNYTGMLGVLVGLAVGGACKQWLPLPYPATRWHGVLRALVGNVGLLASFEGIAAVTPRKPLALYAALRFFKYWLVPVYILLVAPPLFSMLGL